MIGRILYGACAVALVATTAVMAEPSTPSNGDANKQICHTLANTGSRLSRSRECHTAAEWAEIRRTTKQMVDRAQTERPLTDPSGGR